LCGCVSTRMKCFAVKQPIDFGPSPQQIGFENQLRYIRAQLIISSRNIWGSLQYDNFLNGASCVSLCSHRMGGHWMGYQILNRQPTLVCLIGNHFLWTTITELGHTNNLVASYFLKTLDAKNRLVKLYAHAESSETLDARKKPCGWCVKKKVRYLPPPKKKKFFFNSPVFSQSVYLPNKLDLCADLGIVVLKISIVIKIYELRYNMTIFSMGRSVCHPHPMRCSGHWTPDQIWKHRPTLVCSIANLFLCITITTLGYTCFTNNV